MRCIECGATLDVTSEPIATEFRGESLTVEGIEHYICPECGEVVFDSAMNSAYEQEVDREYRRKCGLLSPEEIKSYRNDLGLTQEQFQTLLGVGKLSVCRWETGRLAQSKTVDNLIRAYMSCPRLVNDALERAELRVASKRATTAKTASYAELNDYARLPITRRDSEPVCQIAANEVPMLNDAKGLPAFENSGWLSDVNESPVR